jgi:hypothetical protein
MDAVVGRQDASPSPSPPNIMDKNSKLGREGREMFQILIVNIIINLNAVICFNVVTLS